MADINPTVIPMLAYEDGAAAMDWLCKVFGFTEKTRMLNDDGVLIHGEIAAGDGTIMLATPTPQYQSPKHHRTICKDTDKFYQVPYVINGVLVYVDDAKAHFQRSKENGAVLLSELEEGGPGLRYRAEDLEGQRWMFMQR